LNKAVSNHDEILSASSDTLEAEWNRLALETQQPDPFCATTHWQLAFREALDPNRPLTLRRSDDGLIQFAEHRLSGGVVLGPIERNWLFGCNLLGAGAIDLLVGLLQELQSEAACGPVVIAGIDPNGALAKALITTFTKRHMMSRFRSEVQCAASLEGGLDGFLSRRSANLRRNLRRYSKRAAEAGIAFQRHSPASSEEADAVFKRMLAVELTSWKGLSRCGMESPSMTRFYSIMLRRLSHARAARVMFATRDGRDVGFIFGGVAGGVYRGQQFSFEDRSASLSIGNLMQFEQIQWLCEDGAARYDLGPLIGPSMEYKHHWTELQFPIEAYLIQPQ
jgi:Acetyltransferase (GNAT) domain